MQSKRERERERDRYRGREGGREGGRERMEMWVNRKGVVLPRGGRPRPSHRCQLAMSALIGACEPV